MTRGKTPEWADTWYAQWIKEQLDERGWVKKDLIEALVAAGKNQPGAEGLVNRATKRGTIPDPVNRALIVEILGPEREGPPGSLGEQVLRLARDVNRLTDRVSALERLAPPASGRGRTQR